eukprot:gb/GECH01009450.1/.p1 GENE.gb/GECH01009450.1/~~gb/GECH01009450.1/.p1  ORF type:complete len:250 (+),score=70.63 gb/GECH01009450.1/:1-750(+)
MRISEELIQYSPQFMNPCLEREIDLRGNKIPTIENMGATLDQFDVIDLSDNEIRKIGNFPLMRRLSCLLLNNNRVSKFAKHLGESLPNLRHLILTNNYIRELNDIDPLANLPQLETLSLMDNMVSRKENYRFYTIAKLPKLRVLDFKKIKQQERQMAESMFGKGGDKAQEDVQANTFVPGETVPEPKGLSSEQKQQLREAIAAATTNEEMNYLEQCLREGRMPKDFNKHLQQRRNHKTDENETEPMDET